MNVVFKLVEAYQCQQDANEYPKAYIQICDECNRTEHYTDERYNQISYQFGVDHLIWNETDEYSSPVPDCDHII